MCRLLAQALVAFYASRSEESPAALLGDCTAPHLEAAQRFSWWMTSMLSTVSPAAMRSSIALQLAELDYLTHSRPASTALAGRTTSACRWRRRGVKAAT